MYVTTPPVPTLSHPRFIVKRNDKRAKFDEGKGREKADECVSNQVFLNIVLDDAVEEKPGGEKVRIGMVVRQNENPQKKKNTCHHAVFAVSRYWCGMWERENIEG